ncbi:MAG: 1-deoxy-D-xylulose-5-phosphate reductoisomerase [Thiotrichaceae bacterium]
MKNITILGATGTIGINTLDVIKRHPQQFHVTALTANTDIERLTELCILWQPRYAVMADLQAAEKLQHRLKNSHPHIQVLAGTEGLIHVASLTEVDMVMAAIVGSAGLLPTLAAAQAGKRVLLANKEALVMSGQLFMDAVTQYHAELLPIDSEHNAIFQCLPMNYQRTGLATIGVKQIYLTASGGPFRNRQIEQLHDVTPEQACAHPKWKMGRKISVDSATMMNKGLEVIEACWLFSTTPATVEVVIHPQSIIHSLVEYLDGSLLAQLSNPDMRTPIAQALAFPQRIDSGVKRLNLLEIAKLEFEELSFVRFPCLRLAYEAMSAGGTSTAILNAANEIAVQAFLDRQIGFTAIPQLIENTLTHITGRAATDLRTILEDDNRARQFTREVIEKKS